MRKSGKKKTGVIFLGIIAIGFPILISAQVTKDVLPSPTGPYKTGRMSFHWTDNDREELETKKPGDKRELMVHVFYPRVANFTGQRAVYLADLEALRGDWDDAKLSRLKSMRSFSVENAPVATGTERFPVAIFSPGGGMKALMNQVLIEDLASHGWIVAAIDHSYNALVRFPDGRVLGSLSPADQGWPELDLGRGSKKYDIHQERRAERERMTHWSRDMSFVIDQLTALDKSVPFASRLDLQRGVGAFGHSLGGIAAGTARLLDSRVAGAINLDGWGYDGAFSEIKGTDMGASPFLWILRKKDAKYPDRRELQPITGGALRVTLNRPEFAHGDFSDEGYWDGKLTKAKRIEKLKGLADARDWIKTFFDATVRGDKRGLRRMASRKRNVSPNTVVVFGPILQ